MSVLIATPTTQGAVSARYAQTLVAATQALGEAGLRYRLMTVDSAEVWVARTAMVHAFLADPGATHLLFLDSDMAVEGGVIRRLLARGAPIAGAAYAARRIDLSAYAAAMAEVADPGRARALASDFAVSVRGGRGEVREGFAEVEGFGFGCVLIRRPLLEAMIANGAVRPLVSARLRQMGLEGEIWDFFDEWRLPDGDRLSEDLSFCRRVREMGGVPLVAWVGPGVEHIGPFAYGGAYLERLKAGRV